MALSNRQSLSPFDVLKTYTPSSTTDLPAEVGAIGTTPDGRTFKLGLNIAGGTTLTAQKLTAAGNVNTAINSTTAVTVSVQAIGDTQCTLTTTATWSTAITANQFAGGLLCITTGTGAGQTLSIKGNAAALSTATTVVLYLQDPFYIATVATDTANVWANPYAQVVISPTTFAGSITGVPLITVAADATYGTYAWFQVGGVASVLNQGGTTIGLGLAISATVQGAFATVGATTSQLAIASFTGADGKYCFADLNIFS